MAGPGGFVRTVTGDIAPEDLGPTLAHEHIVVDWGEMLGRPKAVLDQAAVADVVVDRLEAAARHGIGAIVECTPIGAGRYVDLLDEVARRTSVRIVAATGFFHESWCPIHPLAVALGVDALADLFEREITEGMGSTTIRAGIIKVATGEGRISPTEEKVLRAAARAHLRTGCPIITHTTGGLGAEQLALFADEGVPPDAVIISHVGTEPDPLDSAIDLLARGATICVDEISYPFFPDEHWVGIIVHAVRSGHGDRVVIGHDALVESHGPEELFGPAEVSDYTYIPRVFMPKLAAAGLSAAAIDALLVANPRRALSFHRT